MPTLARAIVSIATALTLTVLAAPGARAAEPTAPLLVSPANGSISTTSDVTLSVTAADPDGGNLSVRFEGRKKGATAPGGGTGAPFTLVALPDTQH